VGCFVLPVAEPAQKGLALAGIQRGRSRGYAARHEGVLDAQAACLAHRVQRGLGLSDPVAGRTARGEHGFLRRRRGALRQRPQRHHPRGGEPQDQPLPLHPLHGHSVPDPPLPSNPPGHSNPPLPSLAAREGRGGFWGSILPFLGAILLV